MLISHIFGKKLTKAVEEDKRGKHIPYRNTTTMEGKSYATVVGEKNQYHAKEKNLKDARNAKEGGKDVEGMYAGTGICRKKRSGLTFVSF